jgi:hypothetical protein
MIFVRIGRQGSQGPEPHDRQSGSQYLLSFFFLLFLACEQVSTSVICVVCVKHASPRDNNRARRHRMIVLPTLDGFNVRGQPIYRLGVRWRSGLESRPKRLAL